MAIEYSFVFHDVDNPTPGVLTPYTVTAFANGSPLVGLVVTYITGDYYKVDVTDTLLDAVHSLYINVTTTHTVNFEDQSFFHTDGEAIATQILTAWQTLASTFDCPSC